MSKASIVYKLWFLQVNKAGFSIASPVRFAYLAVSGDTVDLSNWQLAQIVETWACSSQA